MQAASMQNLWLRYRHKRVKFFDVNSGENLSAINDFSRHYGITYPALMDPDCTIQEMFNIRWYPTIILIDGEGKIRLKGCYMNLDKVEKKIEFLLKKQKTGRAEKTKSVYMPEIKYPYSDKSMVLPPFGKAGIFFKDPFVKCSAPSAVCDSSGQIWVSWSIDKSGIFEKKPEGQILLARIFNNVISKPQKLSEGGGDNYSPRLAGFEPDNILALWLNNKNGEYRVVARKASGSKNSVMLVDHARYATPYRGDDMHPSAFMAPDGNLYASWYTWEPSWKPKTPEGKTITRHRHIYMSCYDGKDWTPRIKVSPPPEEAKNDDSTDPEITRDSSGRIWFTWSLDYHPSVHEKPYCEKGGPTIFARYLMGDVWSEFMPVSTYENFNYHSAFDTISHIAADRNGNLRVVWDGLVRGNFSQRNIYVRKFDGFSWGREEKISQGKDNHFDPRIIIDPPGVPWVFWVSDRGGYRHIYCSTLRKGYWTMPMAVTAGLCDNLYPEPVFDNEGNLYLFWLNIKKGISAIYYSVVSY